MLQSLLAVVAGFLTMAVLVGVATAAAVRTMLQPAAPGALPNVTPAYLTVNLAYSALAAIAGGFVTGRLGAEAPLIHAAVLAGLAFVMSVLSARQYAGTQPRWYQNVLMVGSPLLILAGGGLSTTF